MPQRDFRFLLTCFLTVLGSAIAPACSAGTERSQVRGASSATAAFWTHETIMHGRLEMLSAPMGYEHSVPCVLHLDDNSVELDFTANCIGYSRGDERKVRIDLGGCKNLPFHLQGIRQIFAISPGKMGAVDVLRNAAARELVRRLGVRVPAMRRGMIVQEPSRGEEPMLFVQDIAEMGPLEPVSEQAPLSVNADSRIDRNLFMRTILARAALGRDDVSYARGVNAWWVHSGIRALFPALFDLEDSTLFGTGLESDLRTPRQLFDRYIDILNLHRCVQKSFTPDCANERTCDEEMLREIPVLVPEFREKMNAFATELVAGRISAGGDTNRFYDDGRWAIDEGGEKIFERARLEFIQALQQFSAHLQPVTVRGVWAQNDDFEDCYLPVGTILLSYETGEGPDSVVNTEVGTFSSRAASPVPRNQKCNEGGISIPYGVIYDAKSQ